jgi:hypothetical protein
MLQKLPYLGEIELLFDTLKLTYGDLSSNAAMILSKNLKRTERVTEILQILKLIKIIKNKIAGQDSSITIFSYIHFRIIKEINSKEMNLESPKIFG